MHSRSVGVRPGRGKCQAAHSLWKDGGHVVTPHCEGDWEIESHSVTKRKGKGFARQTAMSVTTNWKRRHWVQTSTRGSGMLAPQEFPEERVLKPLELV